MLGVGDSLRMMRVGLPVDRETRRTNLREGFEEENKEEEEEKEREEMEGEEEEKEEEEKKEEEEEKKGGGEERGGGGDLLSKVAERGEYENTHRKEEHKKTQLL